MSLEIKLNKATLNVQVKNQQKPILSLDQIRQYIQKISRDLLEYWISRQQEVCLNKQLGEPWMRLASDDISLGCPQCGSINLQRKSWRTRKISLHGLGKLSLGRRQLRCGDCRHCWMPFKEALKLPGGAYDSKSISKGIDLAAEQSYKKAGEHDPEGPSGSTIHRAIQQLSPPEVPKEAATVAVDATKVPRWRRTGQVTVGIIHEIGPKQPTTSKKERPKRRKRCLLGVLGGKEADITSKLEPLKIRALVHDGNLKLEGQADYVGRCRWHVPYTAKYLLYHDHIRGKDNKKRIERLKSTIETHKKDPDGLKEHLDKWIDQNSDAPVACTHVKNSQQALLTMSRYADEFTTHTTSHMEREMVEINKRFENGGGWTPQGAENLLWLHQLKRFEPQKYSKTKQELINQVAFSKKRNSQT